MTLGVNLVLVNANVLTMERASPIAEAVAVAGERIVAVGGNSDIQRMASARTQVVDCQGLTLLPGFNDAHCHLLGLARRLQDLDCSPERAPSIAALQLLVREWAALRQAQGERNAGVWVRGHGYDDLRMAEGRHPTRWELDAAAPEHPVWLEHRSGHAVALNSRALELADIHRETPDPPGGVIERELVTGEPTGVLFEMRSFLRSRLGSIRSPQEFEDGMRAARRLLSGYGITSAQDAGEDNGIERWRAFQQLQADGALLCRIVMFTGAERLDELAAAGLSFGSGSSRLRLGYVKIMLTLTAGALHPSAPELAALVEEAHQRGFPVAIHCIEEEAIAVAAEVLASNRRHPHPNPPPQGEGIMDPPPEGEGIIGFPSGGEGIMVADRIEHCAEGTPELVDTVRRTGAAVVVNPGFLYHNGAAYRDNVEARLLPHLYPAGPLHRAGVTVAFGSDAPVIDPNPWPAIYSAVTRRASDGCPLSRGGSDESQTVDVETALRMYTAAGAVAEGQGAEKGTIAPGRLADMVLVDTDPLATATENLPEVQAIMTVVGGNVIWSNT